VTDADQPHKRLRLLWPDHLGLARGKYLRPTATATGHCITLFGLGFDRVVTPHERTYLAEGSPDLEVRWDPEDIREGWEPATGIVVPDVYKDGEPVMMAPRSVLQKAIDDLNGIGYRAKVGIELEAYLFQPGDDGGWVPIDTPGAYVYATGTAVDPAGIFDDLMQSCEDVELSLESVHSEYDNGQFELTLEHGDALEACDDAFLFKVLAKEVAERHGLLLTFMGKPISDRGGSGAHINLSFEKSGKNVFFDEKAEDGLAQVAHRAVGGLLDHHLGMAAVCAPTVNAYKRLQPGEMAGYWASWGYDHRFVAVRIPPARGSATRLEHRLSDASVNPHIVTAAILQAARLGIVNQTSSPLAETGSPDNMDADRHVARDLGAALDDLEADRVLVEALSREYVEGFVAVKRREWERYQAHTTDWELSEYLHFL